MRTLTTIVTMMLSAAGPSLAQMVAAGHERSVERGTVRAAAIGLYKNSHTWVIDPGRLDRDDRRSPQCDTAFEIGSVSQGVYCASGPGVR